MLVGGRGAKCGHEILQLFNSADIYSNDFLDILHNEAGQWAIPEKK